MALAVMEPELMNPVQRRGEGKAVSGRNHGDRYQSGQEYVSKFGNSAEGAGRDDQQRDAEGKESQRGELRQDGESGGRAEQDRSPRGGTIHPEAEGKQCGGQ